MMIVFQIQDSLVRIFLFFLILMKKFGAWEEELMRIIQQCLSKIIKLLEDILHGMAKLLKILTQTSMVNANGPLEEILPF